MSYSIYIGNAEVVAEENDGELVARFTVPRVELPEAPDFPGDDMSQRNNGRHPGYLQWANFCTSAGLTDFFFDDDAGVMRQHPGCFALAPHHLDRVREVRSRWQSAHPSANPGMGNNYDGVLARLLWLEWWMDWALKNCERPAIANH